jgi:hypothetical protein
VIIGVVNVGIGKKKTNMSEHKEKQIWERKLRRKYHEDILNTAQLAICLSNIPIETAFSNAENYTKLALEYRKKNDFLEGYDRKREKE